jgi:epi-isozizaene synthase
MHADSTVALHYPADWIEPVHRDHAQAERDTAAWLRELGVVVDARDEAKFRALKVGWYAGSPFPRGSRERLETVMRFLALWIFHDDGVEGVGVEPARLLGEAVRGKAPEFALTSPILRGWTEIGQRCAGMSERWLARHAERFGDWVRSLDGEAQLVRLARASGRQPTVEEFMAVRLINVGVLPTVDFLEHLHERELDEAAWADPERVEAERIAMSLVAIINELCGLAKDLREDWINLVRSVAQDERLELPDAVVRVARVHDEQVEQLAVLGDRLVARHGEALRFWVEGLESMVAGFCRWHLAAPRYASEPSPCTLAMVASPARRRRRELRVRAA